MTQKYWNEASLARLVAIFGLVMLMAIPGTLLAARQITTVHVLVKDATSGEPIYQAHLTLRYRQQGGFMHRSKIISYSSKTDKKGRCQFPVVPMGTITLMVTAPDHNTFGREFQITKQNQRIEVKLQKPHPVL